MGRVKGVARNRKTCMGWLGWLSRSCNVNSGDEKKKSPHPFILFILCVCLFWLYWTESCTLFVFCSHFIRMQLTHHRITFVCNSLTRWLFSFCWLFKYFSFVLCHSPSQRYVYFLVSRCFALVPIQNIGAVILVSQSRAYSVGVNALIQCSTGILFSHFLHWIPNHPPPLIFCCPFLNPFG